MMDNFPENKKKFLDLCESYGVYYYYINFNNGFYHVYNSIYNGKGGCIIPWEHLSVRNPDWEWIEERIVTASLEVFQ